MATVLDVLKERGFVQQMTHEDEIEKLFATERATVYVGIDPTADSIHVGHMLPLMALAHLQRAGHRPIALMGGGTAMVGDPSGKTEMRKMLTVEQIDLNKAAIKKQVSRILDFSDGKALMLDNGDWLRNLNYVEFLREVGSQFSVNRMLAAECFRARLERPDQGLSFLEFNYMLMQAFDFLMLYRLHGCKLQIGGDDQWANIIAGADLIRRLEQGEANGLTLPLIMTSAGKKMGKTEAGAVWLDPDKTSPFDFFQYWRNVPDADVEKFLALYTFLPMNEVRRLGHAEGQAINESKKVLAFEITRMIHGEEEARKAMEAAEALFAAGGDDSNMPTTEVPETELKAGINICDLMVRMGLAPSKSEARRLIQQGGVLINGEKVENFEQVFGTGNMQDGKMVIRKGKKTFHAVRPV
jgi:tyrosyl-tRNA synthetase